jgi:hypothetical protein
LFPPEPPTLVGALTLTVLPAALADADGCELVGLTWTAPTELLAVLPPPTWAVPTELDDVLLPEPETDVGAETVTPPAVAEGFTAVLLA